MRPYMHQAFGIDPTEYDFKVFEITSEISKQIFPITLDLENPKFHAGLEQLRVLMLEIEAAKQRGGVLGLVKRAGLAVAAGAVFARLYFLPVKRHELPQQVRLAPAW
jgi:magnesium-protoporphyrin IX monomethyl ester (oxidative) cyclase